MVVAAVVVSGSNGRDSGDNSDGSSSDSIGSSSNNNMQQVFRLYDFI